MNAIRHVWVTAIALAACAQTGAQWEKSGASQAAVDEDLRQCRTLAKLSAPPPRYTPAPSPSATTKIMSRQEQRAKHDDALFDKCMQDKGYSARP